MKNRNKERTKQIAIGKIAKRVGKKKAIEIADKVEAMKKARYTPGEIAQALDISEQEVCDIEGLD